MRQQLSPTGGDRLAGPRPLRDIKWLIFQRWLIMSFYSSTRDKTPNLTNHLHFVGTSFCVLGRRAMALCDTTDESGSFGSTDRRRWTAEKWTLTWLLYFNTAETEWLELPGTYHKRFVATTWALLHFLPFQLHHLQDSLEHFRLHDRRWHGGAFATKN